MTSIRLGGPSLPPASSPTGTAVAMPLPGLWLEQGLITREDAGAGHRAAPGPSIVLSGSCSAMTNRQVAHFLAKGHPGFRLDPLHLSEHGPGAAARNARKRFSDAPTAMHVPCEPHSVEVRDLAVYEQMLEAV